MTVDGDSVAQKAAAGRLRLIFALKVFVGLALVLAVLWHVDFATISDTLARTTPAMLFTALGWFILSRFLEALRLFVLAGPSGCGVRRALDIVFISTFFNNFAVTVVGDSYKIVALTKEVDSWQSAAVIVVAERVFGVVAIAALGVLLLVVDPATLHSIRDVSVSLRPGVVAVASALILGLVLVVAVIGFRRRSILTSIVDAMRTVVARSNGFRVFLAFALTVAAQVALAAMIYVLVRDFGGAVTFGQNLFVMLIVYAAAFVPITIGSLGVREGTIVIGLGWFGVPAAITLSAALVSRVLIYAVAALAGLRWIVSRQRT